MRFIIALLLAFWATAASAQFGGGGSPCGVGDLNASCQVTGSHLSAALPSAQGGTADTGSAWTAYTPTVTCATSGTITTDTVSGRWKALGKTVHLQVNINITVLGTCLGNLSVTLPAVPQASLPIMALNNTTGVAVSALVTSGSNLVLTFATAPVANNYFAGGIYESQ